MNVPLKEYISRLPKILKDLKGDPSKAVTVVLGNESCDLDSAICSLVLAHHLSLKSTAIPVLNIPKEDVALRTEVKFCLKEQLISMPTRDDVNLSAFQNLQLILVDHHVLQKQDQPTILPKVVQIIDHRQQSSLAQFPPNCQVKFELVGSCATLIAEKLLKEDYTDEFGLDLLRSTILTDTCNLSPAAKKATQLDISILELIEKILPKPQLARKDVFDNISQAKRSIDGFTVDQLFRKDLKIVPFSDEIQAAVPSTLLLSGHIFELHKGQNFEKIFDNFCQRYECQLLIVIGNDHGERDILFYYPESQNQSSKLIGQFVESLINNVDIDAKESKKASPSRCVLLEQGNVTYTRKKILPILLHASKNEHS